MSLYAACNSNKLTVFLLSFSIAQTSIALPQALDNQKLISMSLQNIAIQEALAMIAQKERINVVVSSDVEASVSLSLYDVSINDAIKTIAESAGLSVAYKDGSYFVITPDRLEKFKTDGATQVRTYKVQYADPELVATILANHLSEFGKVTPVPERQLVVVDDHINNIRRIEAVLREVDKEPKQVLIEAQILEITLDESESLGIDWRHLFRDHDGEGTVGIRGLGAADTAGFFFEFMNDNIEVAVDALKSRGRVRTLSTPKLLVMESNEAEVIIGDRLGYRVTTTINQVTNESIEFLESGIILRVTPYVDNYNRILLEVHPEVSIGTISDGIPNQTTTEVTTQLLIDDGQTTFIGGLIKHRKTETKEGLPILGDIPIINLAFSNKEEITINTETVVVITPRVIEDYQMAWNEEPVDLIMDTHAGFQDYTGQIDSDIDILNKWDFLRLEPLR